MSNDVKNQTSSVSKKVLTQCDNLIDFYMKAKRKQRILDFVAQSLIIGMAGVTPLVIMTELPDELKALPAAIATIAVGLNATFRFRATYVNFAYAAEKLKLAKLKFEARLENSNEPESKVEIENFILAIESIVVTELSVWREELLKSAPVTGKGKTSKD